MLKSLIYKIEGLIAELTGDGTIAVFSNRASRERWLNLFQHECELVREKLLHELFAAKQEAAVYRYVQYHQANFIRLSDVVSIAFTRPKQADNELGELSGGVLAELEKLVNFLRQSFYRYFDPNHKLSIFCSTNDLFGINSLQEKLYKRLKDNKRTALEEIILQWFTAIKNDLLYQNCTFYQADQGRLIFRMVNELLLERGLGEDILALALFRENFNLPAFVDWYQESLSARLSGLTRMQQNLFIEQQIQLLESLVKAPERMFEADLPPIEQIMVTWLQKQHTGNKQARPYSTGRPNGNSHMPLNFSVAQFALFVRLLYLEGCFQITNVSLIHRFFTQHFNTKKQSDISVKSFARAFYNSDQSSAAVIRDYLQRMITYIDNTYFPKL